MRIDRPALRGLPISSSGVYGPRMHPSSRHSGGVRGMRARMDALDLSGTAWESYQIHQAVLQTPDVREEVIAPLRRALEAGTYFVPAEQIAEGIVREALFWAQWRTRGG